MTIRCKAQERFESFLRNDDAARGNANGRQPSGRQEFIGRVASDAEDALYLCGTEHVAGVNK